MDLGPRTQEVLHAALGRDERTRFFWERDFGELAWDEVRRGPEPPNHFGFDGEPISMRVWAILMELPERLLKQEWLVPGEVGLGDRWRSKRPLWLSTVWLGLDHNHARFLRDYPGDLGPYSEIDTRPWIFETMLFDSKLGWRDVRLAIDDECGQWRQATWEEALLQHAAVASSVTAGIIPSYDD